MFRVLKWLFLGTVLLGAFVLFGLPLVVNTERGRNRIAELLGAGLDRKVTIGALDIGFLWSSLDMKEFAIANPAGFPAGEMLRAGDVHLDVALRPLLDRKVQGAFRGSGFLVNVLKKGGATNLDGLGGGGGGGGAPDVDLDVTLALADSRLVVEDLDRGEKIELDGVSLEMRLANRADSPDARLKIRIRSVDQRVLRVRDLELDALASGDYLDVAKVSASLAREGTLTGGGRVRVRGGDEWSARLEMHQVGLDAQLMPLAAAMFPLAAAARGQLDGVLEGTFELRGRGLTWEAMKPTLAGEG
ncbi:MAG: hypothetical protein ACREID_09165, partial [Planctomycetota bacterium]